ncbi:hypothetical protein NW752_007555 [Fusarium irregulare]|uniref:2EXR domain-containing protein n=1 Tax=Fusarium irregulare TaxID=2494466 RepID=A0A9W8PK15_9HYPO|nr:hypothetical protein NW766_010148 [Fusarium irregulare]KAJ4013260.1 hypothetical protein NW752_007555 [Fusarium irregulare]
MAALDANPPSDRTEMSLSVFHPFTRLPTEMRWKVWKAACLESTRTSHGLQYIDVKYGWAKPIPYNQNRSAYLFGHGLWKACRESRQVLCQQWEFYGWLEIQKRAIDEDKCFKDYGPPGKSRFHPDILGVKEYPHPAIIDLCGCGEDCRMLVRPGRDIFCLKIENWERSLSPNIYMSFLYITTHTTHTMQKLRQHIPVKKFALEFDKSWIANLPSSMDSMSKEASARGYLAYLLEETSSGNMLGRDLWIIDKDAKWSRAVGEHDRVYRDYDAEYIEAHWSNVVNYKGYVVPPTASQFMKDLEDIDGGLWNSGGLKPKNIVRLLVRRDNQVNDPRLGNAWRDGFGWHIEKHDNWDWQLDSDDDRDWELYSDDDLGLIDDLDRDGDEDEGENLDSNENPDSDEVSPKKQ